LIPQHNWQCHEQQKCSYPCPHELPGFGRILYPNSHLCNERRYIIDRRQKIIKYEEFKNYKYQNASVKCNLINKQIPKLRTTILKDKDINGKLYKCGRESFCIYCRHRSDKCSCISNSGTVQKGLDGPFNALYWNFYCSSCFLKVSRCNCVSKLTSKHYGNSKKSALPRKYKILNSCNCRLYWLNCDCLYRSSREENEYCNIS